MDALPHLAGMLMVMVTLTILWGVCAFTAKLVQHLHAGTDTAAPLQCSGCTRSGHSGTAAPAGIAPEIVAVIAAAVATATGQIPPHRLHQTHEHQLGKSWPPIRSHLTPHPLT